MAERQPGSGRVDQDWDVADISALEGRRKERYMWGSIGFEYVFAPERNL